MKELYKFLRASPFCVVMSLLIAQQGVAQTLTPRYITTCPSSNGFYEYLPAGYNPASSTKYPLILFLHGTGEIGNGVSQLPAVLDNGTARLIANHTFPSSFTVNGQTSSFIVLIPQFNDWPVSTDVDNILDYANAHYNVDQNRVYLTGLSMGGGVTWAYASAQPSYANRLAAILVVSGAYTLGQGAAQIIASSNLPVFATHNSQDNEVSPTNTTISVAAINSSKPPPTILALDTIFQVSSPQHDAWTKTYDPTIPMHNGLNVYQWMLQYSRNITAVGTPLPVTLIDYTATPVAGEQEVVVDWTTTFEQNNKYFILQRSADGKQFSDIDTIPPFDPSGSGHSYTYTDRSPLSGNDFYRLTQTDLDGKVTYYDILKVSLSATGTAGLHLSPNPTSGNVFLELVHPELGAIEVSVVDLQGRTLKKWAYQKGTITWDQTINLAGVAAGTYFIRVQGDSFREVQQVIKK
ncbi:MAG TPA: T9SS type A sorting domain-containing protein [Puia sp.]